MSRLTTLFTAALIAATPFAASAAPPDTTLAYLPTGTTTVVVFDMEAARSSAFFKTIRKPLIDLAGLGKDVAAMKRDGIDLLATVRTLAFSGPDELVRKAGRSVVILEGDFDVDKLKAFYQKKAKAPLVAKTTPSGDLFTVSPKNAIAFRDTFVLIGDPALVEGALAAKHTKRPAAIAGLTPQVKAAKHAFGVISGSATLKKLLGKNFGPVQEVREAALTLDMSSGLKLVLTGTFPNGGAAQAAARAIEDQAKKLAADPELAELGLSDAMNQLNVKTQGAGVTVILTLEGANAQTFAKNLQDFL